jgi:hypothetical protein
MWFTSVFALWSAGPPRTQPGRRPPRPARRQPAATRPTVEALEDRTVPSALAPVSRPDAVAGIVGPLANSQTQSFQASGTFAHTSNKAGTLTGQGTPLGSFTGSFTQNQEGAKLTGTFTLNFGSGSLTCSYEMRLDHATNEYVGTYQVTGGTGALANASGSGTIMVDQGGQGNFSLSGTISR